MTEDITTDQLEAEYVKGSRAAWVSMLHACLRELEVDDPLRQVGRLVAERETAIATLRRICEEFGDNEWPENLHLADIIENHLGRYLE